MRRTPKKVRVAESDLIAELEMNEAVIHPDVAEAFLSEWLRFPEDQRPDKWESTRTGRDLFDVTSLNAIVTEWRAAPLRFSRAARQSISIRQRELESSDRQPLSRDLSAWFARSCGADVARDFWMLAVKHFEPAFAVLTTRGEYHRRHCCRAGVSGCPGIATGDCCHGQRLSETIPGIYWLTYFGQSLVERLGESRLRSIPMGRAQQFANGYVLTAYGNPKLIGSDDAVAQERAIMRHLGEQRFFRGNDKVRPRGRYGSRTQRYAEENRRNATPAESALARVLNRMDGGRLRGRFVAQWAFGGKWILDVYFPELRLGFEVDGGYHDQQEQQQRDRQKERDCADIGIMLIRFSNEEIVATGDDALRAKIQDALYQAGVRRR